MQNLPLPIAWHCLFRYRLYRFSTAYKHGPYQQRGSTLLYKKQYIPHTSQHCKKNAVWIVPPMLTASYARACKYLCGLCVRVYVCVFVCVVSSLWLSVQYEEDHTYYYSWQSLHKDATCDDGSNIRRNTSDSILNFVFVYFKNY